VFSRKRHVFLSPVVWMQSTIILLFKYTFQRWAGYVARMGDRRSDTGISWGYLWERGHLEDLGLDGRIILNWILKKWNEKCCTGLIRGLLVVSRDHFADNGCVPVASQAPDGKDFLLLPAISFQVQQLCARLLRTNRTAVVYNRVQGTLVRRPSAALHSGTN